MCITIGGILSFLGGVGVLFLGRFISVSSWLILLKWEYQLDIGIEELKLII